MTFGKFNGQKVMNELEAVGDEEVEVMIWSSFWIFVQSLYDLYT
jgi:hypothetical protein